MDSILNIMEKYELLVLTLNRILIPYNESNVILKQDVKSNIEELEGDYYSFLHHNFLQELFQSNMISQRAFQIILEMRCEIEKIASRKWNVEDFLKDESWLIVRQSVVEILLELKNR